MKLYQIVKKNIAVSALRVVLIPAPCSEIPIGGEQRETDRGEVFFDLEQTDGMVSIKSCSGGRTLENPIGRVRIASVVYIEKIIVLT
jgi:hypothetical protein